MPGTFMAREIAEVPEVVSRQLTHGLASYLEEGRRLAAMNPRLVVTCARGTSDHAASYLKYLVETRIGIPVASVGPSVASIYKAPLRLPDAACVTISQSGGSPDLLALQETARKGGARTVALLNVTDSPVGGAADCVLPLLAGPEKAIAATKSFVASLFAISAIVAAWTGDKELEQALNALPDALAAALNADWSKAAMPLAKASSLFTLSRGPGLSIAFEAALKFKETCRLHAEAFSAAEVRHGPIAISGNRFAALVFMPQDESRSSVVESVAAMRATGARIYTADCIVDGEFTLLCTAAPHLALRPLVQVVSFYIFVETLARELGEDPDAPGYLRKVTETL